MLTRLLALLLALIVAAPAPAYARDAGLRQVVGILDYVASDYAGAVDDAGRVTQPSEFREQLGLVDEARALAGQDLPATDPVLADLADLRAAVVAHASPAEVRAKCRTLRKALVDGHGLVLAPERVPDQEHGKSLYTSSGCAGCHGATGAADTPVAATLDPRPANLLDPKRMADVSPFRAMHAITFGVEGTAMTPQDLPAADRWDLAFYVVGLRHAGADLARGKVALEAAGMPVAPTATRLSQLSDRDLVARLAAVPEGDRSAAIAWLRRVAPYDDDIGGPFATFRHKLDTAVSAYAAGHVEEARVGLVSAYLDGFEPHEVALSARDAQGVREIEQGMVKLRAAVERGDPPEAVREQSTRLEQDLDRILETPKAPTGGGFLAALLIALREGLEMVLLVGLLLAVVRRRELPGGALAVHLGWITALVAGALTWLAIGEAMSGLGRELSEGIASLLAAVVLVFVTHWTFGQASSRQWLGMITRGLGRGALPSVFGLAFLAIYRELVEVILFFKALALDTPGSTLRILAGAATGFALMIAAVAVLRRFGRRLPARPFFLVSAVLLAGLAVVLTGNGVHALQEAAVVPYHTMGIGSLPLLGIYDSVETFLAQGVLVLFLVATALPAIAAFRQERREDGTAGPEPEPAK